MVASFASRGFDVIGVDINQAAVDAVNAGRAPVQETNLGETLLANLTRIRATRSHAEAVSQSDISFVIVPTPSDERGSFSLQYAEWAFQEIGRALRRKKGYHNVVLTSTVLPGATRYSLIPILERESGKTVGRDFGVCYSPEFIALGSIIHDFLNPDFTLIGEFDTRSGDHLADVYERTVENEARSARMTLENAELTKISINTFVTTKITFANMLAEICENLPGGNVDAVTSALGLDARIGRKYLTGAIGYGGPCFPRDNVALSFIARELDVEASIAETTDTMNRAMADKIAKKALPLLRKGSTVVVLGLSYKPYSHVTEESQGVYLARLLSQSGLRVVAFDPMSKEMEIGDLRSEIVIFDSIDDCLKQAEAVFITTPDPLFVDLTAADFDNEWPKVTVFDFWRILFDRLSDSPRIRYIGTGLGDMNEANSERLRHLWQGIPGQAKGTGSE